MSFNKPIMILVCFFMFCLCISPLAASQSTPDTVVASDQFNFGFDIGRFRAQDGFVLVELYYSIFRNHLKFIRADSGWQAAFNFRAEIWQNDSLLATDAWKNINQADSLEHITAGQKLFGLGYFAVKPGAYLLKVKLTDENSKSEIEKKQTLTVEPFSPGKLALSDIELATQIRSTTETNRFYKNGYMVIPNPDQFYGTGLPMLMFYSEIYNLSYESDSTSYAGQFIVDYDIRPDGSMVEKGSRYKAPTPRITSNYSVQYRIIDGEGQVVREFPAKIKKGPGESAVEVSGMNIISFRSGTYYFELEVIDLLNNEKTSRRKKFFIYREGDLAVPDSVAQRLADERLKASYERIYKNMPVETLNEEFDAAAYIATNEEKNIFKTLDVQGKQSFLMEFWKKRDTSPETASNEFRDNYLKLVNTANKEFTGFKKGYKSDRGRVLLLYGVPDEIERFPLNMEHKEYQHWKYFSIQGGVEFIFVDKQGFGSLDLVHSTARGELSDPGWERWIDPNR